MVDEELVGRLKAAYEAWIGGDPGPADAMMADDIKWIVPGDHALSGTHNGVDEVHAMWGKMPEHLRGLEVHDLLAGGDQVAVTNTVTLTSGSVFQVDLWRFEGGKAVEFRAVGDPAVWNAAFGQ